jgi:hypothetical protein
VTLAWGPGWIGVREQQADGDMSNARHLHLPAGWSRSDHADDSTCECEAAFASERPHSGLAGLFEGDRLDSAPWAVEALRAIMTGPASR